MKDHFSLCLKVLLITIFLNSSCQTLEVEDGQEYGTLSDSRDGEVYKTVKIGTQTWFVENLRFEGNIPQVASQQAWAAIYNEGNSTDQPAWSYYNNNSANDAIYGKLYNWYAVNTGTLCPSGWHIPTEAEWTILTDYLGGVEVAGGKMKSIIDWETPNVGATNESGFTGLPGGIRTIYGEFDGLGVSAGWWSSSPSEDFFPRVGFPPIANLAFGRILSNSSESSSSNNILSRSNGHSCRCLKD